MFYVLVVDICSCGHMHMHYFGHNYWISHFDLTMLKIKNSITHHLSNRCWDQ